MNSKDLLNSVYDLIAQNGVSQDERDDLTDLVDHVDLDRQTIVFKGRRGHEFELRLVGTYAPAPTNSIGV